VCVCVWREHAGAGWVGVGWLGRAGATGSAVARRVGWRGRGIQLTAVKAGVVQT